MPAYVYQRPGRRHGPGGLRRPGRCRWPSRAEPSSTRSTTLEVTHAILAPAMVDRLLARPDLGDRDLSSLEAVFIGGAPSSPDAVRESGAPRPVRAGLGLRHDRGDRCGVHRWSARRLGRRTSSASCPRSVRPGPLLDVRVVGSDGADVPDGDVGEVVVRGDSTDGRLLGRGAELRLRRRLVPHGRHGDRDADGRLFLVDRRADVIVSAASTCTPRRSRSAVRPPCGRRLRSGQRARRQMGRDGGRGGGPEAGRAADARRCPAPLRITAGEVQAPASPLRGRRTARQRDGKDRQADAAGAAVGRARPAHRLNRRGRRPERLTSE